MAQLIDYTPGPVPGSYSFLDADTGKSFIMDGIEAERTARGIDAQKMKGPDMRVAGDGGGENMSVDPGMSVQPEPNMSVDPGPTQNASVAPAQETPKEEFDPRVYAGKGGKGRLVETRPGKFEMYSPGSPGISKAQLQQKQKDGTPIPAAQRETVEGGYDPDQQYLLQIEDSSAQREMAATKAAEAEKRAFEAEQKLASDTASLRQIEADQTASKRMELEDRVEKERLSYDSAVEGVRGKKVNSNRLFSGAGGKMRLIGLAIANGFAGYASAVLGRPNDTWQIINGAIDRDISEQEHEIMQGNKNVDNALSRLTRSTGSLDQAKILLKTLQHEHAVAQAQEIASGAKSEQVDAKLQMFMADEAMKREAMREEYLRLAAGKHTAAIEARYAYPVKATGPTRRPATIEETQGVLGVEKESQEFRKRDAEITKTLADAEAAGKGPAGRGPSAADKSNYASAVTTLNGAMDQLNLSVDPKTRKIVKKGDIPGVGLLDQFNAKIPVENNKHSAARQTVEAALLDYKRSVTGLAATDAEAKQIAKVVYGTQTESDFVNGMNILIRQFDAKKGSLEGGDLPEAEGDTDLPEVEHVN
jgi:hypothetical protein